LTLPKELSISAGVGIGRMKIDLQDRYYVPTNTKPTAFDTSYRNMVSPHFAVNKVFNKNVSAYFSYSTGYKAPVSSYFYIPFVAAAAGSTGLINQGLKPEKGNQIEIGTKGSLLDKRLVYQLSLYDAVFANKMAAVNVLNSAGTSTLYTYIANSGKQDDKGIEGVLKYTVYRSNKGLISSVTPFVNFAYTNYTYVDYKFHYKGVVLKDSVVNFDGKAVAGVPKKTINIGVDCKSNNGFNLGLIYMYKGAFPITSDGNNQTVSYGLLNAKIGYEGKLISRLSISASVGINNITGVQYPIMVFVNQLPDAYIAAPLKAQAFATVGAKWLL
jgi:iron complex outermembrane receptor protein